MQGQHISLTQQIQQFTDTLQQFILNMGEDAATNHISNSVFYISIGINDYIHYYLLNVSNVDNLYLPWHFNHFLASSLKQEIKVKCSKIYFLVHYIFFLYKKNLVIHPLIHFIIKARMPYFGVMFKCQTTLFLETLFDT